MSSVNPFQKTFRCGPTALLKKYPQWYRQLKRKEYKYYTGYGIASHKTIDSSLNIYSEEAFSGMRIAGKLAANTLRHLHDFIEVGMSTMDIHFETKKFIENSGGIPSSIGFHGFPGSICTSLNTVACHGIPNITDILCEGDIISLDVTCSVDGWHGDTCYTYFVGDWQKSMTKQIATFLDISQKARNCAINVCRPMEDLNTIGITIENYLKQNAQMDNYCVFRNYTGHGIGRSIHEAPEVLHTSNFDVGWKMTHGMIFTIEPIILLNVIGGKIHSYVDANDGWTVYVPTIKSAQFEHCIGITENGYEIFTLPDREYPDVWKTFLGNDVM